MLNWGLPWALWFGLAVLPVAFFYFLRMRFKRQPVSSTYLWEKIRRTSGGASRLRFWSVLLLMLQIAAVVAAVLALAGPVWNTRRLERPGTMFLIDTSASMETTDERPDRLSKACSLVEKRIRRLPPGESGLIVSCGSDASFLGDPTSDHNRLIGQLKRIRAGHSDFDEASVALSLQQWLDRQERTWKACLVTDGGLSMGGRRLASLFNGALSVVSVGRNGHNLGLTGLRLNDDGVRLTVVNGWPTARTLRVRLERNGALLTRTALQVPPGISLRTLKFTSAAWTPGIYAAIIEQKSDASPEDDRVYLAVNPPRHFRVLLVTAGNPFLQAVLDNPDIDLSQVKNFPPGIDGTGWDLTIADHVRIPENYRGNLISFGMLPPGVPIRPGRPLNGVMETADSVHPLLRFVDWRGVRVAGGRGLTSRGGVQVLATVNGEPAIVAWENQGRRVVVCGTDLYQSELGLSEAFPVFLQNMVRWCVPQGNNPLAYTLTVGHPAVLAESQGWHLTDSAGFDLQRQGTLIRLTPRKPGFTHWQIDGRQGILAANIPFSELMIAPAALEEDRRAVPANVTLIGRGFPLATSLLAFFLIVMVAEWILWRGGWRLRKGGP